MKRLTLHIIIILSVILSTATAQNMDSIKLALKNAKHDTLRIKTLIYFAEVTYEHNPDSALIIFGQVDSELRNIINKYTKINNEYITLKRQLAISYRSIGQIFKDKGDIPKTLNFFSQALKVYEELKSKSDIATMLNNIGVAYKDINDLNNAKKYYYRALSLRIEIGDKKKIGISLHNIGSIYLLQGRYTEAIYNFKRCLDIFNECEYNKGIPYTLNEIGTIYKLKGNYSSALTQYERSLFLLKELKDLRATAHILNNIGEIYFIQKDYDKALKHCSEALSISSNLKLSKDIRNSSENLYKIYKARNNFQKANEYYELYINTRDSINNMEVQKAAIKIESQNEYDKKKAVEDEKHAAELKVQDEKAKANKKRQNIIIGSVSVVLLLVSFFSILLYNRFKTTQKQKLIIEAKEKETQAQKHIIEEKQKEILDSINYAKRIQYTLLAHEEFLKENLPEHFTYFNPKDIVSGDFYWATKHNNKFYLAVCDSTGHGVPGAFMSLLNIGFLNEAINEKGIEKPNEVFNYVRQKLTNTISKEGQKDGFDGILVCFDQDNKQITYAAANNAPVLIKTALRQAQGPAAESVEAPELVELNADRMPVGMGERKEEFKLYNIEANPGDTLYLYTDGYADQFGGPKGKKFKYKQLNELLISLHKKPLNEQHTELRSTFENWKGNLEQVDDVCVIGIKL